MSFTVVLVSRPAGEAGTRCDIMPRRHGAAKCRVIAQYSSQRRGAWAVAILESAALPSYLLESVHDNTRVRAIPVSTPQEGFDLARQMIQGRSRPRSSRRDATAT